MQKIVPALVAGTVVISVWCAYDISRSIKKTRKLNEQIQIINAKTSHINTLTLEVGRQVASTFEDIRIALINDL